ncbi:MAG: glycosyltransferase [Halieaceae bacterium]|nr:glycosyltransferase [Halieaceae bacterium]
MSRLDILYLVGGFSVGGTERHLSLILPALADDGYNIRVCALGSDGPMSESLASANINVQFLVPNHTCDFPKIRGFLNFISIVSQVIRVVRENRPKIVHCFLSEPSIIGYLATVIGDNQHTLVLSKRNQLVRPSVFFGDKFLERIALRSADRVVAHSSMVRKELISIGVNRDQITVIHNGIPPPASSSNYYEDLRTEFRRSEKTIVFVCLANLIPYKGHRELLSAMVRFDQFWKDWTLLCIGETRNYSYTQSLKKIVEEADLEDKVNWLGMKKEPSIFLQAADVGILVSHHEGFSNAILEYMSYSLPTIATNVGGNSDAVNHGETGWLIPFGDQNLLLEALKESTDNMILKRYSGAAYASYLKRFTQDSCVKKYHELYQSL